MNLLQKIMSRFRPMLTCEQVNQFIVDYMEGAIPPETRKKFEKHINMCKNCDSYFDQYKQTVLVVNEDGQIEVPDDLAELTLEFLRKELSQN